MQFDFYPLVVTERRNLNRPESPCVEDDDYDFLSCVTRSVVDKGGCRYPWDNNNSSAPVCTTIEKILETERLFFNISKLERKDVVNMTGCKVPCTYREYTVLNDLMKGLTEGFGVAVVFPSTEIRLEEEDYVYPILSFVAELGGALGMFLGFSFLMVWDFLYLVILTSIKYAK